MNKKRKQSNLLFEESQILDVNIALFIAIKCTFLIQFTSSEN